ncbi:MAG: DNA-binding protein [Bacteroidota bacterium]
MAKITLSTSRDIPFNKLVLSQANVRHVKAGVSIEELAEDIALRTLLQSLTVRAIVDADGVETGLFEVPVGGRRFRALELLVKQKRLAKTAPIPCVIRTDGLGAEDSLAENLQRAPLHPLDQFRAFLTLCEAGMSEEDIAARFFVAPVVVKQRLRLVTVSPKLLDLYAEDQLTLEQLMAFSVTADQARQEQVWDGLSRSYHREPYYIRKLLTEGAVRASDKRAQFVGIAAYEAAGGVLQRDLFEPDDGGWLQDPALLDRLVATKLEAEADVLRAEGWKWVEAAPAFPYGHTNTLRRLSGEAVPLTEEEQASLEALQVEHSQLVETYAGQEDVPEEVDLRLNEIGTAMAALQNRPLAYDPTEVSCAGAFVSIDGDGKPRVERGYVRPEDEPAPEPAPDSEGGTPADPEQPTAAPLATGSSATVVEVPDEDDVIRPLPDRLITELTAHRTLALRDALANAPDTAFLAVLHVLCLKAFYRHSSDSCLEIEAKSASFASQAPGLADSASAKAIDGRHQNWARQLPQDPANLWEALTAFDGDSQSALFAHCAALTVSALYEPWNRRPRSLAHADRLALAVGLDMAAAGWAPTVDNYLGRVTKARILEAVREAQDGAAAQMIDHLRKPDMAREAERLLDGSGWLPEPLRMPKAEVVAAGIAAE